MDTETGQSEDLNGGAAAPQAGQVEENGVSQVDDGANVNNGLEHEGDNGDQGQQQPKTRNAKQRLRRKLNESEARNAQLAEDNRNLHAKVDTLAKQVDGVINPPAQRPDRVNFESEAEYEDALFDWNEDRKSRAAAEPAAAPASNPGTGGEQAAPAVAPFNQEMVNDWEDACDDAREKYDDFNEIIARNIPITSAMAETVMVTENGTEVAYHLGKNPKEAARIAGLSLPQQVQEITNLAKKFGKQTTSAPSPITPVQGQDEGAGVIDPEKLSPEEYRDWRRKTGRFAQ